MLEIHVHLGWLEYLNNSSFIMRYLFKEDIDLESNSYKFVMLKYYSPLNPLG
jgi:hypothetical protein